MHPHKLNAPTLGMFGLLLLETHEIFLLDVNYSTDNTSTSCYLLFKYLFENRGLNVAISLPPNFHSYLYSISVSSVV